MTPASFVNNWHRHVVPFTLAVRLASLTSPTSLAVAAELPIPSLQNTYYAEQFQAGEFLVATNTARLQAGATPLSLNTELSQAARAKAEDMAARGYWDHFRPNDQKAPWDFIKEEGYRYTAAGENLARGFNSVEGITKAWLASPQHRANVLSEKYTDVGFSSIVITDKEGKKVLLTVQMFGAR